MRRIMRGGILLFLLSSPLVFADVTVESYTSYGAEIKRAGSETWTFIKVGDKLNATSILRIPPNMNLHVSVEDDFIQLPRGREGYVEFLLEAARKNEEQEIVERESRNTEILETDSDASRTQHTDTPQKKEKDIKPLDDEHLLTLASIDESTLAEILEKIEAPLAGEYPFRNKGYAEKIFVRLLQEIRIEPAEFDDDPRPAKEIWNHRENQTVDENEFAILYLALLNGLKIPADFRQNRAGEILVLFDTGRGAKQVKQITTNRELYQLKADQIWIPLLIKPFHDNFVVSWYRGGDALRLESDW